MSGNHPKRVIWTPFGCCAGISRLPALVSNRELSGGEALVEGLAAHGVDTVFGIPGVQTYALFDALGRRDGEIRVIAPRHEQATAYMAFGYAKAGGRPGVFAVVPGVGLPERVRRGRVRLRGEHAGPRPHGRGAIGVHRLRHGPSARAARPAGDDARRHEVGRAHRQPGRRRAPRRRGLLPDVDRPAAPGGARHALGRLRPARGGGSGARAARSADAPGGPRRGGPRGSDPARGAGADDHGGQRGHGRRR